MSKPKYEEIKQDIVQKILSKELQPGEKVSSEAELKTQYNVSSTTVVKALNELVSEGYVFRVQGKGTFVSKASRGMSVKYYENDYRFYNRSDETVEVLSIDDHSSSEVLGYFEEGLEVKEITRLKYATNEPMQLSITYIDSDYIDDATEEQLKSIYDTVKSKKNINLFDAKFEENFQVLYPVPTDIRKLMKLTEHEPVIHITQKTYSTKGQLIEFINSYKKHSYFNITISSN